MSSSASTPTSTLGPAAVIAAATRGNAAGRRTREDLRIGFAVELSPFLGVTSASNRSTL